MTWKIFSSKISIALLAMILFFIYYHMSMRIEINSDMASGILEARDIASGNLMLKGWNLSTVPFYFTELIWYSICIFIFGISYKLSYVFSAFYLVVLCIVMVMASENKKTGAVATLFLIGSPVVFLSQNLLTPVVHVGTYIFSLCVYIIAKRFIHDGVKKNLFIAYVIMSLLYFSDAMSMYLVFIPLIVTSLACTFGMRIEKRWYYVTAVSVLSYITALIIWKIFIWYGFSVPGLQETKFATTTALIKNVSDFFEGTLRLYSAYFFGLNPKSKGTAAVCLSFLAICIFFGIIILRITRISSFRGHDIFLLTAMLIMPVAFITSDISVGLGSIRYIIPFFIFGSVFISANDIFSHSNKKIYFLILSVFTICSILHIRETLKTPLANDRYMRIDAALSSLGVSNGFAAYWDASAVTIYGHTQVAPVYSDGKRLVQFDWLSKKDWYQAENNFVIIENDKMRSSVINAFGPPDKTIHVDEKEIFVWNKKIWAGR
jgi:hypothetical protein